MGIESSIWIMRFSIFMLAAVLIMGWMFWKRAQNAKKVIGKVYCEFITPEGKSKKKLLPLQPKGEIGIIEVKPYKDEQGKIYVTNSNSVYDSVYPEVSGILSVISAPVKKVLLNEGDSEPLSNRGNKMVLDPVMLYSLINEGFTYLGVELSQVEAKEMGITPRDEIRKKKNNNISWKWILIMIVLLVLAVGGFLLVKNWGALMAALGK